MPALRTNTASGCWREVSRERESERRDGTAATNEFRQLPKIRPEIHHWRFPPISNLHSPPKNRPRADRSLPKSLTGNSPTPHQRSTEENERSCPGDQHNFTSSDRRRLGRP